MKPMTPCRCLLRCTVLCWIVASVPAAVAQTSQILDPSLTDGSSEQPSAHDKSVAELIDRLGDDAYVVRTRARAELERAGLRAFDQLHAAQYDPRTEIALAARHLVSDLMVAWALPSDPPSVREALNQYGRLGENSRRERIEILAGLPDRAGAEPLARLARYETSARLSGLAAIAILKQSPADDSPNGIANRQRLATQIGDIVDGSDRVAARWLAIYADDLADQSFHSPAWSALIVESKSNADRADDPVRARNSTLSLVQTIAAHAVRMGRVDDATDLTIAHLDLVLPKTSSLVDASTWAVDHGLFIVVDKLRDEYGQYFDGEPILLYAAAESAIRRGNDAEAQLLAEAALSMPPIPPVDEIETAQPRQLQITLAKHGTVAERLQNRGLFEWSIREYRGIVDALPIEDTTGVAARSRLALMLSELERHADVIELLQPLIDRVSKDRALRQQDFLSRRWTETESMLLYHQGEVAANNGDIDKACDLFERALNLNPDNIDILIRMYRIDRDDGFNAKIRARVKAKISELELQITTAMRQLQIAGALGDEMLAHAYNNYAWMVANTEGDYEKALEVSLKAVRQTDSEDILNAAARLDTCARCYYALGKYEQAIAMQKRAIQRTPHSLPLLRQLALLEKAHAESSSNDDDPR